MLRAVAGRARLASASWSLQVGSTCRGPRRGPQIRVSWYMSHAWGCRWFSGGDKEVGQGSRPFRFSFLRTAARGGTPFLSPYSSLSPFVFWVSNSALPRRRPLGGAASVLCRCSREQIRCAPVLERREELHRSCELRRRLLLRWYGSCAVQLTHWPFWLFL